MIKKINCALLILVVISLNQISCNQKKDAEKTKKNQLESKDIKLEKGKIDALINKDDVEVYWFLKPTVGKLLQYDGDDSIIDSMQSDENGEKVSQEYSVYYDKSKIVAVQVKNVSGGNGYSTYMYYYKDDKLFYYDYSLMNASVGNVSESAVIFFDSNNNIVDEKYDIDKSNGSKSHNKNDLNKPLILYKNAIDIIGQLGLFELLAFKNKSENATQSSNDLTDGYFQGQKLKEGEKIITVDWNMEDSEKIGLSQDTNDGHYASPLLIVPNGKKWILLFAIDNYTYSSSVITEQSYLNIDDKIEDFLGEGKNAKTYLQNKNINLSKAKDMNIKLYSGTKIRAISGREINSGYGKWLDYKAEICFLEVNE